jgi:hypothetical protein
LASAFLTGCVGIDRTVFFTKTNRGLDIASAPPTVSLDIGRDEGVITPQFQNGKTSAVLASFKTSSDDLFAANAGSTFATGDAAMTLATLYDSPYVGTVSTGELELDARPTYENSDTAVEFQEDDVRPLVFSTKTSLGLRVGWSSITSTLPDNFTIGFNRTELALLPVTLKEESQNKYKVNQASLLATLEYTLDGPTSAPSVSAGEADPNLVYLQYFATGNAASRLATQPKVRSAMLARLDPQSGPVALPILTGMLDLLAVLAEDDTFARSLQAALEQKQFVMPSAFPDANLVEYIDTGLPNTIELNTTSRLINDKDVFDMIAFLGQIRTAIETAETSLEKIRAGAAAGDTTFSFLGWPDSGPRAPTAADIQTAEQQLNNLRRAYLDHYRAFSSDADVITAYRYLGERFNTGG